MDPWIDMLSLKECMHHAIAISNCTQTIIGNAGNEQRDNNIYNPHKNRI